MKKLGITAFLLLTGITLTGCTSIDSNPLVGEKPSVETTTGDTEDNITGGAPVEMMANTASVYYNNDGNFLVDSEEDIESDSLEGSGFEVNVQVYDTDGDGLVNVSSDIDGDGEVTEKDQKEKVTIVTTITNNSGETQTLENFTVYANGLDSEKDITIENVESLTINSGIFQNDYNSFIHYINDDTKNSFDLMDGQSIKLVLTGTALNKNLNGYFPAAEVEFYTHAKADESFVKTKITSEFEFAVVDNDEYCFDEKYVEALSDEYSGIRAC